MGLTLDFEWWQLWTCHLAHWDARHLLLNVLAALPPLLLLPRHVVVRLMAWCCFAAAPLLSLTLIATGALRGEYRGASGLVVALWSFAAIALLRNGERMAGQLLVAAVFMKLLAELAGWWPAQSAAFVSLAAAHVAGALIGMLAHVFVEPRAVMRSRCPRRQDWMTQT